MLCGLTGGIGCGKTTVARLLVERGALRIDADQIARDVIAPDTDGFDAVIEAFGDEIVRDGMIDRGRLGHIVFSDAHQRAKLNAITHPRIASLSLSRIQDALATNAPLVIYEAALLIETGRSEDFRPLIVVTLPHEMQLARVMHRNQMTRAEALARIEAQMPLAEKVEQADFVVDNAGSLIELADQVDSLWGELLKVVDR